LFSLLAIFILLLVTFSSLIVLQLFLTLFVDFIYLLLLLHFIFLIVGDHLLNDFIYLLRVGDSELGKHLKIEELKTFNVVEAVLSQHLHFLLCDREMLQEIHLSLLWLLIQMLGLHRSMYYYEAL
jgi:hypothetical protein